MTRKKTDAINYPSTTYHDRAERRRIAKTRALIIGAARAEKRNRAALGDQYD